MPPKGDLPRWRYYIDPLKLVIYAIYTHITSLLSTPLTISAKNPTAIRSKAFAKWHSFVAPHLFEYQNSTDLPRLINSCYGTVLEVGAGDGIQMTRLNFSPANSSPHSANASISTDFSSDPTSGDENARSARVQRLYALEPNPTLHSTLCSRVSEAGLEDKYIPILGRLQDKNLLERYGIVEGSIDSILCVQVLCCVSSAQEMVRELYKLLKPGGMIVFWEHRGSKDRITRCVQWIWNCIWPLAIGGCRLDGRQDEWLLNAGEWEVLELGEDSNPKSLFPEVWGRLVKVAKKV